MNCADSRCAHPQGWHRHGTGSCLECGCSLFKENAVAALPRRIVVDQNGNYWRSFEPGVYSMCPVGDDNEPVEVVAVYQIADELPPGWHRGTALPDPKHVAEYQTFLRELERAQSYDD